MKTNLLIAVLAMMFTGVVHAADLSKDCEAQDDEESVCSNSCDDSDDATEEVVTTREVVHVHHYYEREEPSPSVSVGFIWGPPIWAHHSIHRPAHFGGRHVIIRRVHPFPHHMPVIERHGVRRITIIR